MKSRVCLFLVSFVFISCAMTGVSFGQTDRYAYDDLNRLARVEYYDGTVIEYTYDELGNRMSKYVVSDVPVAVDDSYGVNEGGTINAAAPGVLGNDTDAQDDSLTAHLVTDVSRGALSLNADGSFIYIHDGSNTTSDRFTYKANDGELDSNIAAVNITVNPVNDPPELAQIGDRDVNEGGLLEFIVSASDADGDDLIYSASNLPAGAGFDVETKIFSWTPTYEQGDDVYTGVHFEVEDTGGLTDSEDITITVNDVDITPPVTTAYYDGLWHNENFTILLTVVDSQSNVANTYYRINDGPQQSLIAESHPLISVEGADNTLEYWSIDEFDNEELPHNILREIKLDKTVPLVSILSPEDEAVFDEGSITIAGMADDALSGVEIVEVEVGGIIYTPGVEQDGNFSVMDVEIVDGANSIIVKATDAAGNEAEDSRMVFLGWMLHLQIPYYEVGDYYSGAACSQMILNYIRDGVAGGLAQDEIYNYGHLYNYPENEALLEMDPQAIDYALGHFDPYDASDPSGQGDVYKGYNFGIEVFESDKFTEYLRDIIHWMAYPVTIDYWWLAGDLVDWPNVPAVVPAYGMYEHWIVVNGASTSENPTPEPYTNPWYTPDFTVYGLWLTDPSSDGIGQDLYVTAQTAQETYLLPVVTSDIHNGKFLQVAEPPLEESRAEVRLAGPKVNEETLKIVEIAADITKDMPSNLSLLEERLESAKRHIYDAALVVNLESDSKVSRNVVLDKPSGDLLNSVFAINGQAPIELDWERIVDSSLLTDENFRKAFDGSQARSFVKVRRADKENSFYYFIPFDKYVKGQFLTCAAVIINAQDGSFQEASWVDDPTRFIKLSREEATELLLSKYSALQNAKLNIELIWEPGSISQSPFYPYWKISSGDGFYFVTQNGEVIKENEEN